MRKSSKIRKRARFQAAAARESPWPGTVLPKRNPICAARGTLDENRHRCAREKCARAPYRSAAKKAKRKRRSARQAEAEEQSRPQRSYQSEFIQEHAKRLPWLALVA